MVVACVRRDRHARPFGTGQTSGMSTRRTVEQPTVEAVRAARAEWRRSVRRQLKIVSVAAFVVCVLVVIFAGPDKTAWTTHSSAVALEHIDWSGRLEEGAAMTAVTGLVALVGALSVTLVVAPRVTQERALVDRVALAQWSGYTTVVNACVAGVAVGVAITQLASSDLAGGIVMIMMALSASAIAAISVQRRFDKYHGGLGAIAIAELRSTIAQLRAAHPRAIFGPVGRRGASEAADVMRVASAFGLIYLVSMAGVCASIAIDGGMALTRASSWVELGLVAFIIALIASSCSGPWYYALFTWTRATVEKRRYALRKWFVVGVGPAFWTTVYWMGAEGDGEVVETISVAVLPPTLSGALLAILATSGRGPWNGVARDVLRTLRRELRVALQRHDELERVVISKR
jgi:hypothetical protein